MLFYGSVLFLILSPFIGAQGISPQVVTADFSDDDTAPTPEMARKNGYLCETHEVATEDGFLLHVHRLPGGRAMPLNHSQIPVLLQHGLLDSSADWVMSGPNRALGYLLADQGYDVWLGNARGNVYSKKHRSLKSDDPQFWNWTWHEMGYYDLPAVIDYILQETGHKQIYYIGHSMGTTMFYVLCSTRPEYNAKVRYMAALAPVAFMTYTTSPIRYLAPYAHKFEEIADFFGNGEFLPRNSLMTYILKASCEIFQFEEHICENYLFVLCGHDPAQFDEKLLPLILGHNPAGTSTKTLVHYAQEIGTNNFQQYDYGSEKNIILYNSTTPPQYNLSMVTVPVSLHYGDNDLLASPLDVNTLFEQLHNPIGMFRVNLSSFNHLDFLWARDVKQLVYNKVGSILKAYSFPSNQCVQQINIKADDTVAFKTRPCVSDSLKKLVEKGTTGLKSFTEKMPIWKNSVLSKLQFFSKQFKTNRNVIAV